MNLIAVLSATPQTKAELAKKLGWSTREVEAEVNRLRLSGTPIVSDSDGYRLATSSEDVWRCFRWLRSKYQSQARTAWSLRRAAMRMEAREAAPLVFFMDDAA